MIDTPPARPNSPPGDRVRVARLFITLAKINLWKTGLSKNV